MTARAQWGERALIGVGALIATYLTVLHFDASVPLVCSDRGFIDCQAVLSSPQSSWLGIPVCLVGLTWFLVYGALTFYRPKMIGILRAWSMLGVATVCYLVYVEFMELGVICLWCSTLHAIILGLFAVEMIRWWRSPQEHLPRKTNSARHLDIR